MNKQTQIDAIMDQLEQGVEEVFKSDHYQKYLAAMAKFHTYSISNSILIWMQRPDATLVAGYQAWKKEFNRSVRKGEKSIKIIAPIRRKKMYPVIIDNEIVEDTGPTVIGYRAVSVFDIAQTFGDELPFYMKDVLPGMVKDYDAFEEALLLVSPVPVLFEEIDNGAHGFYRPKDKNIAVSNHLSQVQTIKTLLHEMTHAFLHNDDSELNEEARWQQEIQAESVAYTVCSYYGIDTSEYSFPYIAGWSGKHDTEELKQSLQLIRDTANRIITTIDRVRTPNSAYASYPLSLEKTPDVQSDVLLLSSSDLPVMNDPH